MLSVRNMRLKISDRRRHTLYKKRRRESPLRGWKDSARAPAKDAKHASVRTKMETKTWRNAYSQQANEVPKWVESDDAKHSDILIFCHAPRWFTIVGDVNVVNRGSIVGAGRGSFGIRVHANKLEHFVALVIAADLLSKG